MKQYELTKEKMGELFPCFMKVKDEKVANQILAVWQDMFGQGTWDSIEEINFCPGVNDYTLQGHINAVTEAAIEVAKVLSKTQGVQFDEQLLITLGLLHDVSKLVEYKPDGHGGSCKTELGEKIQHGAAGAICAEKHGFSLDVVHLILTHTPLSKIKPALKEGILFCYVDLADADALFFETGQPLFLK